MLYYGAVSNVDLCPTPPEILAIAENRLLGMSTTDAHGNWSLDIDGQADWIITRCRQTALAATAARPENTSHLTLPDTVALQLEVDNATEQTNTAWIDPIALEGFPEELLWSLYSKAEGTIDLHVTEFHLPVNGQPVTVSVQRGQFKLSGGTIALHPSPRDPALELSGVTHIKSGQYIAAQEGQVLLTIEDSAHYRLHFAPHAASEQEHIIQLR